MKNHLYTLIGIDKLNAVSTSEGVFAYAKTYDLDTGSLVHESDQVYKFHISKIPVFVEKYLSLFKTKYNRTINRVRIFPGRNFTSALQIADTFDLIPEYVKSTKDDGRKTVRYNKGTLNLAVLREVPHSFSLSYVTDGKVEPTEDRFNLVIDQLISSVGLESLCKKTVTALSICRKKIKDEFDLESVVSTGEAGDQALFEEDVHMNSGGRMFAKDLGVLKDFNSVDINSAYTYVMLTKKFSTSRMFLLSRSIPEFNQWHSKFSKNNRMKFLSMLKELADKRNLRMRVMLHLHDVSLKEGGTPLHLNFSGRLLANDFFVNDSQTVMKGHFMHCMFLEEAIMLVENYDIPDNCECEEVYYSETVLLPKKVRNVIWKSMIDVSQVKKNKKSVWNRKQEAKTLEKKDKYGKEYTKLLAEEEFKKLIKNNYAGYFQYHYFELKNWSKDNAKSSNYNAKAIEGMAFKARNQGSLMMPLVGSEITFEGRQLHRRLEKHFADRGFTSFYANTDSLYLEKSPGLDKAVQEWNDMISSEFNNAIKDLDRAPFPISRNTLPGTIKKEKEGKCIHMGLNKMICYDSSKEEFSLTLGGINGWDVMKEIKERNLSIEDIKPGTVFHNVAQPDGDPEEGRFVVKDWTFR